MSRLLVLVFMFCASCGIFAQAPDSSYWVPNGPVNSLVLKDSILFVGGEFDHVSPVTGSFVRLDTTTALPDLSLFKINGAVHAMAMDSNGYVYVGGSFTRVGNQLVENFFRITPSGEFDNSFVHGLDGPVYCMVFRDSLLYLGGDFDYFDSEMRHGAAAWDLTLNELTAFDPSVNGPVYAMCPDEYYGYMVLGGDFTTVGTFSPPYLAKVDFAFGVPMAFNAVPWTATPNCNGPVRALAIHGQEVYAGGEFTSFASIQRKGLVVLGLYNGVVQSESAGCNGVVNSLMLKGSKLFVGGEFSLIGGDFRDNLACLDTNMILQTWAPAVDGIVYCMGMIDSNTVLVGGDFIQANGDTCMRAALIDTAGAGFVHLWNPNINGPVYCTLTDSLYQPYVGGAFFGMGGVARRNLFSLNINTGVATDWHPQVNYQVNTLYLDHDTLYLAGDFTVVNNAARNRVASIDISTAQITGFNPGCDGLIRTFAISDSLIYMGGNFSQLAGQPRQNLGCVYKSSGTATGWNPACAGTVNTLLYTDNWIYVAGFYSTIANVSRDNLARISTHDATADWNWFCNTDDGIYHAQFYNNNLVLGGWFGTVNNQTAMDFAIVDTVTLQVQSPAFLSDGFVRTFTNYGDDFFVSGNFDLINNQYQPRLFDFDSGDNQADPWTPAPNAAPVAMIATGDKLMLGGAMASTAGIYHPYLQVLNVRWITDVQENIIPANDLQIYPVPAADFVTVSSNETSENAEYTITDLSGKIVQCGVMNFATGSAQICVAGIASGTYIMCISSENSTASSRMIIAH